jgi:hypothetical protein
MPIPTSAYQIVEQVLNRIRVIINDSEVAGGDVLTDTAPFTFDVVNGAFERVQIELARVGVETMITEAWLIGLPVMPIIDPEARMVVDDTGTNIFYPNGIGNVLASTPQLPQDLIFPLKLWERQNNTTNFLIPMMQPNTGLFDMSQQTALVDWEWLGDGIRFRGALQSEDVKIKYEKHLPILSAPTDPVPIRGVVNAAAYHGATIFTESRGGAIAPQFKLRADEEISMLQQISARRRQRKQVRRQPYSGRGTRIQSPI